MATTAWIGAAQKTAQVSTVTPASVGISNTFTVTIGGRKSATFTATATTVANVTAGLVALLRTLALTEPDVAELTVTDSTTCVTLTGPTDGTPFTVAASAAGGSATNTAATVTTPTGPNDWSVAANWSGGAVPVAADDVVIDKSATPIRYGLAQSGVALASLTIGDGFTGTIGLPQTNPKGYAEYRPTYLAVGATAVNVGQGDTSGGGSGRIKIDTGTGQTALAVYASGQPAEVGLPAVLWTGTHASNAVTVIDGSVGLAVLPGEAATVATLRVGGGQGGRVQVFGGGGLTLTTLDQSGGEVTLAAGLTTVQKTDGTLTVTGSGAVTTIYNDGGPLAYSSTGTVTTLKVSAGGAADFGQDARAVTVTNCTLEAGGGIADPFGRVTWTNGIVLSRCALTDVTLDVGTHKTLTVAAGP